MLEVGQGNFDHAGRLGLVGGSAPSRGHLSTENNPLFNNFFDGKSNTGYRDFIIEDQVIPKIPSKPENVGDVFIAEKTAEFLNLAKGGADTTVATELKNNAVDEISKEADIPKEVVNRLVEQWMFSSNDTRIASLLIQKNAAELFGISLSDFQKDKLFEAMGRYKDLLSIKGTSPELLRDWDKLTWDQKLEHVSEFDAGWLNANAYKNTVPVASDEDTKKFLKCVYDRTQESFKKMGVTEVLLARGCDLSQQKKVGTDYIWEGNTMESWSSNSKIAGAFGNAVAYASVPVDRIISSCVTGFGCFSEHEFVVLGDNSAKDRIVLSS